VKQALFQAAQATGVRYVWTNTIPGQREVEVCDVGRDQGQQTITLTIAKRSGTSTIRLLKKVAYLQADAFTLVNYFGFSTKNASAYANRWISFVATDAPYASLVRYGTLGAVVPGLEVDGPYTIAAKRGYSGTSAYPITGVLPSTGSAAPGAPLQPATLYVAVQSGYPVGLEPVMSAKATNTWSYALSNWNERVVVTAPKNPVSYASIAKALGRHAFNAQPLR